MWQTMLTSAANTMSGKQFYVQSHALLNHFKKFWRDSLCFSLILRKDAMVLFVFLLAKNYWINVDRNCLNSSIELGG